MVNTIKFIVIIRFYCFVWLKINESVRKTRLLAPYVYWCKYYRFQLNISLCLKKWLSNVCIGCLLLFNFILYRFFSFSLFQFDFLSHLILLRSKIINFQILLSPLHSLHHYYSKSSTLWILHLPKNHLRKFNLCSKLKSENKISNFSDQMSMSQKKRKVLIDHPLWFLEILEMKVSLIF